MWQDIVKRPPSRVALPQVAGSCMYRLIQWIDRLVIVFVTVYSRDVVRDMYTHQQLDENISSEDLFNRLIDFYKNISK